MFENRVLRKIPDPERDEVKGDWRNCTTRSFKICKKVKQSRYRPGVAQRVPES